jgi:hypothetical protein
VFLVGSTVACQQHGTTLREFLPFTSMRPPRLPVMGRTTVRWRIRMPPGHLTWGSGIVVREVAVVETRELLSVAVRSWAAAHASSRPA